MLAPYVGTHHSHSYIVRYAAYGRLIPWTLGWLHSRSGLSLYLQLYVHVYIHPNTLDCLGWVYS
jgi:hypothetical protein